MEEEVAPAPTLLGVARRFGPRGITDGVVPLVLFLVLDDTLGLVAAVVAATVWSLGLMGWRVRTGRRTGPLLWLAMGYVALRGGLSAATGSTGVFFGPGIVTKAAVGVGFLVSAALGRPAVSYIGEVIYPFTPTVRAHPAYRRVFTRLTLAWALLELSSAALEAWLLATASTSTYLLVKSAYNWPLTVALLAWSLRYPRRVFAREPELAGFVAAAEGRLAA